MRKLLVNFQLRDIESDQLREGQPMKPSVDGVTGNRLENYPRNSSNWEHQDHPGWVTHLPLRAILNQTQASQAKPNWLEIGGKFLQMRAATTKTTQAGARISHYGQNQNNSHPTENTLLILHLGQSNQNNLDVGGHLDSTLTSIIWDLSLLSWLLALGRGDIINVTTFTPDGWIPM